MFQVLLQSIHYFKLQNSKLALPISWNYFFLVGLHEFMSEVCMCKWMKYLSVRVYVKSLTKVDLLMKNMRK